MPQRIAGAKAPRAAHNGAGDDTASEGDLRRLFQLMALTRAVDDKAWTLNRQGRVSFVASCRGHEAAQVGSALALRSGQDIVFSYYRDIGVALTLGMDPRELFMSSLGKPSPINGSSRHLPWHLTDASLKMMPSSSVVGTQIPQAAGAALASKLRHEDTVTIVYFGDGATSEGDFHEGMNWAGVHHLPLVFFCQNNGYAISVPAARQMPVPVAARAAAYGFDGVVVDGSDPVEVLRITRQAMHKARTGGGPTLIDAKVRRLRPHSSDDDDKRYLSAEEWEALQRHDPMDAYRKHLVSTGVLDEAAARRIEASVKDQVEQAADAADRSPEADPAHLLRHLFAEDDETVSARGIFGG